MRGRQLNYASTGPVNEHQAAVLEGVAIWAAYYRSNIYRFVEDYFHITLTQISHKISFDNLMIGYYAGTIKADSLKTKDKTWIKT